MAMTIKDYEERIAKNEEKLAKIEKRIAKWQEAKSDEKFAKHFDWLKADDGSDSWMIGWDGNNRVYGTFQDFKAHSYDAYLKDVEREIRVANRDKEDTINTINKYKNAMEILREKDAKPVIQIFKDFFDSWKEEIKEYVKPLVDEYYETNSKAVDMLNNRFHFQELGYTNKEEFDAAYNLLRKRKKDLLSEPIVRTAIDKGLRRNATAFNKYLDDYMNDRYFELVNKVTKIVGNINDVSNLSVGMDGTLNGRVYGDKGGAKIDTIVAGGYNTDVIVNVKHGQIRHYRVLVRPIKK